MRSAHGPRCLEIETNWGKLPGTRSYSAHSLYQSRTDGREERLLAVIVDQQTLELCGVH